MLLRIHTSWLSTKTLASDKLIHKEGTIIGVTVANTSVYPGGRWQLLLISSCAGFYLPGWSCWSFSDERGKNKKLDGFGRGFSAIISNANKAVTCKTFSLLCCPYSGFVWDNCDHWCPDVLLSLMHGASCLGPLLACLLPILLPWMHYSRVEAGPTPRTLLLWKG